MSLKDKIITFDLDGTLARNDSNVSTYSAKILEDLVNEGYHITFVTGRQWVSARNPYLLCHLKEKCVLGNGTVVYDPINDKNCFTYPMDENFIFALIDNPEFLDLISDLMFEHGITTYSLNGVSWNNPQINGNFHQTKDCEVTSMVALLKKPENTSKVKEIIEKTNPKYTYRSWGCMGEVYNKNFSKKDGVEVLLKMLNKTFDDLVFFGDANNDVEILSAAKYGVCMKNGTSDAKNSANMITDYTNEEDGAVKFLLKLIENDRI